KEPSSTSSITPLPHSAREQDTRPLLQGAKRPTSNGYRPYIPERVSQHLLIDEVTAFFSLARPDVEGRLQTYQAFHDAKGYARTLGERKTLCFEEAFVLAILLGLYRPRVLVEIGTQHGASTRRILDIINLLGLDSRMVCFDVRDEVEHFTLQEADLVLRDVSGRFA